MASGRLLQLWYTKGAVELDLGTGSTDAQIAKLTAAIKSRGWVELPAGTRFRIMPPEDATRPQDAPKGDA